MVSYHGRVHCFRTSRPYQMLLEMPYKDVFDIGVPSISISQKNAESFLVSRYNYGYS